VISRDCLPASHSIDNIGAGGEGGKADSCVAGMKKPGKAGL
jgi:hypothetical protein